MSGRADMLAKIHIAKKDLGLDDDIYRAIIARHGDGKTSSRDLSIAQLDLVVREFTGKGWIPKKDPKKIGKKPKVQASREQQMAKIEALLTDKAKTDGRTVSWNYAHAIAKRVCKVDRLEFCDSTQLGKVIAALVYNQKRQQQR